MGARATLFRNPVHPDLAAVDALQGVDRADNGTFPCPARPYKSEDLGLWDFDGDVFSKLSLFAPYRQLIPQRIEQDIERFYGER
jgi:hypothetical protein